MHFIILSKTHTYTRLLLNNNNIIIKWHINEEKTRNTKIVNVDEFIYALIMNTNTFKLWN